MAVTRMRVDLQKREGVFSCGERVEGGVIIEALEDVDTMGVELLVYGGARILLTDKERKQNEPLTEEEVYIRDTYILWGHPLSPEDHRETLEKGNHYFPFSFNLPDDIPCSYEGVGSWVRYYFQGRLVSAEASSIVVVRQHVTVLRDFDLNTESVQTVAVEEKENIPRVMCCHPGRISCSFNVPQTAVVPGQTIKATVKLANTSILRLKGVSVLLQQIVRICPSEYKGHQLTTNLSQSVTMSVPPGYKGNTKALTVTVPPVAPTGLEGCSLISIKYCLTLSIPLSPAPLEISIPVVIGTIPFLAESSGGYAMQYQEEDCSSRSITRSNEWTLSPSSYQLSKQCDTSSTHRPKYKTYTFEDQDELILKQINCSPKCFKKSTFRQKQYLNVSNETENVESNV